MWEAKRKEQRATQASVYVAHAHTFLYMHIHMQEYYIYFVLYRKKLLNYYKIYQ